MKHMLQWPAVDKIPECNPWVIPVHLYCEQPLSFPNLFVMQQDRNVECRSTRCENHEREERRKRKRLSW